MARILLVDDDDDVRRAMSRTLQRLGHEITSARAGREALASMEECAPDLLLTDINMPDMDGIELMMAVRKRWPGVPIIAVSGGGMLPKDLLLANASVLGAVATLQKPVELSALKEALGSALGPSAPASPPGG